MNGELTSVRQLDRNMIETFIYEELDLLDNWKLMEWAALFAEEGHYLVPAMNNASQDFKSTLYVIADDYARIRERAIRLLKKESHIEYPHSITRHIVGNVLLKGIEDEIATVHCNFVVYRTKREKLDAYVGQYKYKFVVRDGRLQIAEKRAHLSLDSLRPQGKISIVL